MSFDKSPNSSFSLRLSPSTLHLVYSKLPILVLTLLSVKTVCLQNVTCIFIRQPLNPCIEYCCHIRFILLLYIERFQTESKYESATLLVLIQHRPFNQKPITVTQITCVFAINNFPVVVLVCFSIQHFNVKDLNALLEYQVS